MSHEPGLNGECIDCHKAKLPGREWSTCWMCGHDVAHDLGHDCRMDDGS